jgi:hypothetical protein
MMKFSHFGLTLRVGFYEYADGTVVEFAEDKPRR